MSEMSAGTSNIRCIVLGVAQNHRSVCALALSVCSLIVMYFAAHRTSRTGSDSTPSSTVLASWPLVDIPGKGSVSRSRASSRNPVIVSARVHLMLTTCHHPCSPSTTRFPSRTISFPMHPLIPSASSAFEQFTIKKHAAIRIFHHRILESC
jgi:hypothetical protein